MQINHNNIVKTIKIRWVYEQINTKIITWLQLFGIQLMPPHWGVPVGIVHSSPTNMGHRQHFDTR